MGRICHKQQEQNLIFDKKVTSCRYGMYVKAALIQTYQAFVGIVWKKIASLDGQQKTRLLIASVNVRVIFG